MKPTDELPKIYIFCETAPFGYSFDSPQVLANAVAEDGTLLAQRLCRARIYVRHDMGLISKKNHETYARHYKNGYRLVDFVDLTEEEQADHPEMIELNRRHNETADGEGVE